MNERKPINVGVKCPDCKIQEWIVAEWMPPGPPVGFHRNDNSGWSVSWKCPQCGIEISGRLQVDMRFEEMQDYVSKR